MSDADGLFHIDANDRLTSMVVTPYTAEVVLQSLLSRHPDLLAGRQMDPHDPRRWLLVAREYGVPDREEVAYTRWSLDHLFVDQDAVPTLIEVKRSTDTRIRREVVGQMLDYAANGVLYWPVDKLRESFVATQRDLGEDPDRAVRELTDDPEKTLIPSSTASSTTCRPVGFASSSSRTSSLTNCSALLSSSTRK